MSSLNILMNKCGISLIFLIQNCINIACLPLNGKITSKHTKKQEIYFCVSLVSPMKKIKHFLPFNEYETN